MCCMVELRRLLPPPPRETLAEWRLEDAVVVEVLIQWEPMESNTKTYKSYIYVYIYIYIMFAYIIYIYIYICLLIKVIRLHFRGFPSAVVTPVMHAPTVAAVFSPFFSFCLWFFVLLFLNWLIMFFDDDDDGCWFLVVELWVWVIVFVLCLCVVVALGQLYCFLVCLIVLFVV